MFKNCDGDFPNTFCYIGNLSGWISSFIWFVVLFPQIIKNYRRKSVKGISNLWASMNFFASLINVIFIYSSDSMPLYSRVSSIYMPVIEYGFLLQIFYYHDSPKSKKRKYFLLLNVFIVLLLAVLIFLAEEYKDSLTFVEWASILLWSFETFPQILLNFKLENTIGLSKFGQIVTFVGKTCDIISNYLLIIPYQYRFLGFFSTTNAYICIIQVLFYFKNETSITTQNEENLPLQNNELYTYAKTKKHLLFFMGGIVLIFCSGTSLGFIYRISNLFISIPLIIFNYLSILTFYFYVKYKKNRRDNSI